MKLLTPLLFLSTFILTGSCSTNDAIESIEVANVTTKSSEEELNEQFEEVLFNYALTYEYMVKDCNNIPNNDDCDEESQAVSEKCCDELEELISISQNQIDTYKKQFQSRPSQPKGGPVKPPKEQPCEDPENPIFNCPAPDMIGKDVIFVLEGVDIEFSFLNEEGEVNNAIVDIYEVETGEFRYQLEEPIEAGTTIHVTKTSENYENGVTYTVTFLEE